MRLFLAVLTLLFAVHTMAQAAPMHVAYDSRATSGYGCYTLTMSGAWKPAGPVVHGPHGLMITRTSKFIDRADQASLTINAWTALPGDVIDEKTRIFNELHNGVGAKLNAIYAGPYSGQTAVYSTNGGGQAGGSTTLLFGMRNGFSYFEATVLYAKPPSQTQILTAQQMLGTVIFPPLYMSTRKAAHP
jgi:hypothetical protein